MKYAYIYYDENRVPYYVGEGSRRRYVQEHGTVPVPSPENIEKFPLGNQADAFQAEMLLIALYGRRDLSTGILLNQTDGGPGIRNCPTHRAAVRVVGLRNKESGRWDEIRTREARVKGGRIGGRKTADSGHLDRIRTHEGCVKAGKAWGHSPGAAQGRKKSGAIAVQTGQVLSIGHFRWHVNRGLVKPGCPFCEGTM